jgi:hypothetical protein
VVRGVSVSWVNEGQAYHGDHSAATDHPGVREAGHPPVGRADVDGGEGLPTLSTSSSSVDRNPSTVARENTRGD